MSQIKLKTEASAELPIPMIVIPLDAWWILMRHMSAHGDRDIHGYAVTIDVDVDVT